VAEKVAPSVPVQVLPIGLGGTDARWVGLQGPVLRSRPGVGELRTPAGFSTRARCAKPRPSSSSAPYRTVDCKRVNYQSWGERRSWPNSRTDLRFIKKYVHPRMAPS